MSFIYCLHFGIFYSLLCTSSVFGALANSDDKVLNLVAEPDYRAVRLKWNYQARKGLMAFDIKYCEITNWQTKNRCREQLVTLVPQVDIFEKDTDEPVIHLRRLAEDTFEASITNLRMLSNYSIAVRANYGDANWLHSRGDMPTDNSQPQVFVETKSFAAKTSRCLANSSDIEVQTGPYFGGKISVEGSSLPFCATYGNRSSSQGVYQFTINHELCGSKVKNSTRIETMVIVHENKDILTHNSRRYMVVCTFTPEVYSLTASVAVPNHLLRKFFDRIREKQLQLQISTGSKAEGQSASLENGTNSAGNDKASKWKRLSVRRQELLPSLDSRQSHLRDSRMLAEDTRAKWLKQSSLLQGDTGAWEMRSLLQDNKMAIICALAFAAVALICLLLLFKLRSQQVNYWRTGKERRPSCQRGSSSIGKPSCSISL